MMTRREFCAFGGAALAAGATGAMPTAAIGGGKQTEAAGFSAVLNPSTIRGYKLDLPQQIQVAVKAGFDGLEPWLCDIHKAKGKGQVKAIRKLCEDNGFALVNGIGFAKWAVSDETERAKGLEELKRDMEVLRELGCGFVAAPPFGIHKGGEKVDLPTLAGRYERVLEIGEAMGVKPILEFWGHSTNLSRLSEALYLLAELPRAAKQPILADAYHMYKGGSSYAGLELLAPEMLPVMHVNDVPPSMSDKRELLVDADRIWPGDGIVPWAQIGETFRQRGLRPALSIELFNPEYTKSTPDDTVKTALQKVKQLKAKYFLARG
ncbi:MAG: sugar phosphate isomerase/epimerase family protein [Kiritimatiellia bacterium]